MLRDPGPSVRLVEDWQPFPRRLSLPPPTADAAPRPLRTAALILAALTLYLLVGLLAAMFVH